MRAAANVLPTPSSVSHYISLIKRLTVIESFERSEFIDVLLDKFRETNEEFSTCESGRFEAPDGIVGFLSGVDCEVYVCGVSF